MPFFLLAFIILAAVSVGMMLLRPKPTIEKEKPFGLSDINFPVATEALDISVIRGTVKFDSPNCGWAGDFATSPVMTKQKTLFGSKDVESGRFKYHTGFQVYLAHGGQFPLYLKQIQIDDKTVWTGSVDYTVGEVYQPQLFGGDEKEGGYVFKFEYFGGSWSQGHSGYLEQQIGGYTVPNYRGISHFSVLGASFRTSFGYGGYIGTSTNLKPFSFVLSCIPTPNNAFNSAYAVVNGDDYNPAYWAYELLTNKEWGKGYSDEFIDLTAFNSVAQTLYNEGLGISIQENSSRKISDIMTDIQKLIDGVIYFDRLTTKWTIKLARKDYNVNTLPIFDETNVIEFTRHTRTTHNGTVNHIIVPYVDKNQNFKERPVEFKNLANAKMQNEYIKTKIDLYGVSNANLASKLAYREAVLYSANIASGQFKCNRQGHNLRPLTAFKLKRNKPDGTIDIEETICRVIKIDLGDQTDSTIIVDYVEDVFSVGNIAYPIFNQQQNTWANTTPIENAVVIENPYNYSNGQTKLITMAENPDNAQINYDVFASLDAGVTFTRIGENINFTPTGDVSTAITRTSNSLQITMNGNLKSFLQNVTDKDIEDGNNIILIQSSGELIGFTSFTIDEQNNIATLNITDFRGLLDTTPEPASVGDKVYFMSYMAGFPDALYDVGASVTIKFVSKSIVGGGGLIDNPPFVGGGGGYSGGHPVRYDMDYLNSAL